jgi:hypothetical protein
VCPKSASPGAAKAISANNLAGTYARQIPLTGTAAPGSSGIQSRNAETPITPGLISAPIGDLEQTGRLQGQAIAGARLPLPSLPTMSPELAGIASERYPGYAAVAGYLDQHKQLRSPAASASLTPDSAESPARRPSRR